MTYHLLDVAECRMRPRDQVTEAVYDRVAGKAVSTEYETLRRSRTLAMIGKARETLARRLVWC